MQRLPPELWLEVFEHVAYVPAYEVDATALRSVPQYRNPSLRASSLVCKDWVPIVQKLLFRNIWLATRKDAPEPSRLEMPRSGSTEPALLSLIATLERMRAAGSDVPDGIRSLHLGIGETFTGSTKHDISFIRHGATADVAHLIFLCPGMRHLSLSTGIFPQSRYPDVTLAQIDAELLQTIRKTVTRLHTLSLTQQEEFHFFTELRDHVDDTHFYRRHLPGFPWAALQLLAIFAPVVTKLDLVLSTGSLLLTDDERVMTLIDAVPAFDHLHTLGAAFVHHALQAQISSTAPLLRSVSLEIPFQCDLDEMPVERITEMTVKVFRKEHGLDFSRFSNLQSLTLWTTQNGVLLSCLSTVPRDVKTLTFLDPAALQRTVPRFDTQLRTTLRTFRALETVRLITAPYEDGEMSDDDSVPEYAWARGCKFGVVFAPEEEMILPADEDVERKRTRRRWAHGDPDRLL